MKDPFDEIDDLLFTFTDMLVGAVKCFIPIDVLDDEQVHKLDSIEPLVMDYDLLFPGKDGQQEPWGWTMKQYTIYYNRKKLRQYFEGLKLEVAPPPITLFILIKITIHEMIHILFPKYNENQVYSLSTEWLNAYDWGVLETRAHMRYMPK